ncbi:pantoate--beta-alanine ligase [Bacteroidota bacterium]
MKLSKNISESRSLVKILKNDTGTVGLVPTMGSLHEGHISLINKSTEENDITVVSIFVNPTQFNEKQDFDSYPRNLDEDLKILDSYPVDFVFAPPSEEIYPEPDTRVFDFGGLEFIMEGKYRPGHFNGVAQVVSRLFEIIDPDRAYFGEKDFQQMAIIRKIVQDLKLPVEVIGCRTIREEDGLAMSSRNKLLSPDERKSAAKIPEALKRAKKQAGKIPVQEIIEQTIHYLNQDPQLKTEYFEIVDEKLLQPVDSWAEKGPKRGCIAVKIGKVRLIDNIDFSF